MHFQFKFLVFVLLIASAVQAQNNFRFNSLGFHPDATKEIIYVGSDATDFSIVEDGTGDTVFSGSFSEATLWEPANEMAQIADFSSLTTPGTFSLESSVGASENFQIVSNTYTDLLRGGIKAFYYNRASIDITEEFAGPWARKANPADDQAILHPLQFPDDSRQFSTPKGWYDAGDYGRYIVNSGVTVYTMLALYDAFPDYFDTLTVDIPEKNDDVPDLLDEIRWNIEWMLTLQDTVDGGVFSKQTSNNFAGTVMPENDRMLRMLYIKTSAAAGNFAGVMAMAARVYQDVDADFSNQCAEAAVAAYNWAINNLFTMDDTDLGTGGYVQSLGDDLDDVSWAAHEVYAMTQSLSEDLTNGMNYDGYGTSLLSWGSYTSASMLTVVNNPELFPAERVSDAMDKLKSRADIYIEEWDSSGYHVPMNNFFWGSNSAAANIGILLLNAFNQYQDSTYLKGAQGMLDYIMGRNPLDRSFVTGFGKNPPMDPHHRPSEADTVEAPVPGWIIGGPHNQGNDLRHCGEYRDLDAPAKSYIDDHCSYATNEVAINWNAAFVYLTGALDALYSGATWSEGSPALSYEYTSNTAAVVKSAVKPAILHNALQVPAGWDGALLQIYDLRGKVHFTGSVASNETIRFEYLSSGLYLVHLRQRNGAQFQGTIRITP